MDRDRVTYEYLQRRAPEQGVSPAGTVLYGILLIYIIHQVLVYFNFPILSPQEIFWNALVYVLPKHFLLDSARRQELEANSMLSQTHAAKSDALRRMLGMGGSAVMQNMPAGGIMRRASTTIFSRPKVVSNAPPGLGNWDNSCYQNSVLQGLASLDTLKPYLERTLGQAGEESSTSSSLLETVGKLKSADNNGKHLWTPAKLKSMSSWQQQDAQEYFSKIMDELDKEAAKATVGSTPKPGLETIAEEQTSNVGESEAVEDQAKRNPMEGMLAQKVVCTRCGFSEGLSMIPFNCLTVPLGSDFAYDLDECLDEYTKLEEITDVECAKCTLLRAEKQLRAMLPQPPTSGQVEETASVDSTVLALPPELRAQAFKRLAAIRTALDEDDFEDKTISEKCEIGKKARVSSTKTRQAVIARAPQSLIVHVNRSVFDEMTGAQRKNYAQVRWPGELDLGAWMLRGEGREGGNGPSLLAVDGDEISKARYRIKAVVTHYGRHENGHYICYRRHPVHIREAIAEEGEDTPDEVQAENVPQKQLEERWWRLSDEDVSSVSEDEVLGQGGVFMLFYEGIQDEESTSELAGAPFAAANGVPALSHVAVETPPVSDETGEAAAIKAEGDTSADVSEDVTSDSSVSGPLPPSGIEESAPFAESSTAATTTDTESEAEQSQPPTDDQPSPTAQKAPTPPLMRTARGRQPSKSEKMEGFGGMGIRPMAAT